MSRFLKRFLLVIVIALIVMAISLKLWTDDVDYRNRDLVLTVEARLDILATKYPNP